MKNYQYLIAILLLLGLTACGGTNTTSSNNSSSAAIEPTETPVAVAEANADASSQDQANQPAEENSGTSSVASGNCNNEYYPVKSGAAWNYTLNSSLSGTDSFTRSILDVSNGSFTDQDAWEIGTTRTGFWSCENGNLTALSLGGLATVSTSEQTFVATSQESSGVTYPSVIELGTNWSQNLTISGDMELAEGMSGSATADATQYCTAVGEQSVTVPAGTFNAMKLNCSSTISITVNVEDIAIDPMTIESLSEVYLVRGVGMVKMVDDNEMAKSTIELTSYAIP